MSPPRVILLDQTCTACPSQWEGRTDDGRHVYIRYRGGWLSAGIAATIDEAVRTDTFFGTNIGTEFDGWMDEATMRRLVTVFDFDLGD